MLTLALDSLVPSHGSPLFPWLAFLCFPLLPILFSHFLISSLTIKLISSIFFGQVELGVSPSPILLFLTIPSSPRLFFCLYEYIYMDRIKKNKIDFSFLSFSPSCLSKPHRVKTWDSPHPPEHLYIV